MPNPVLGEDCLAVYHDKLSDVVRGLHLHEPASVMKAVGLCEYPDLIPGTRELRGLQHRLKGRGACRHVHRKLSMDEYSIFATPTPPRSPREANSATGQAWCSHGLSSFPRSSPRMASSQAWRNIPAK